MCRVEERVYINQDGTSKTFEDSFPCDKARKGRLCSNVTRKIIKYHSQPSVATASRDGSSSPAYPPTPTESGTILVQKREPAGILRRPSTKDGKKVVEPKIIIEFGKKKEKSSAYPSSRSQKRSSLASSIGVDDIAAESPSSDASYTLRTGFPEATGPNADSFHRPSGYSTRPAVPLSHHRHTSSASSFTTSSQPPSLYATSDPESPSGRRIPRYPPALVHNPMPSSPTVTRAPTQPSSSQYRTTLHTPHGSRDNVGADGVFPVDYSGPQPSSSASSGRAPEILDRDADRARLRAINAEQERKRQEEHDRRLAEDLAAEEARQARYETGRYEARDKERKEKSYAEREQRKFEVREEERDRRQKLREQETRDAKKSSRSGGDRLKEEVERRKRQAEEGETKLKRRDSSKRDKDPRPIVRDHTAKRQSRRNSIALDQEISKREHELALIEDQKQMARERAAAEQREADERAAALRLQQSQPGYWDPRGGDRYPIQHENPAFGRRNSITGRRPSISSTVIPPTGLARTNSQSRRVSVHQNDPPRIDTSVQNPYSMRPPSSQRQHAAPPVSFPSRSGQSYSRPTSAHGTTSFGDNPFLQSANRTSPPMVNGDPWDARNIRDSLLQVSSSHHRQSSEDHDNTLQRRGQDVISRAAEQASRARQASRKMGKVVGFEDDYEGSSSENSEDRLFGQGPRLGLGQKPKRKY
ncbi:hypothetical protein BDV96DRAFT_601449 [Lophiotrema nucula]|uniref:Uncharacterized protein n=1 Tax=Lophiotrema nucula TaxID=690887 RepID=A0A6A5Z1J9_9PLEO|nr:hypothetical protein BDV96DRAFT_601449 [Lophiotrema nucula]